MSAIERARDLLRDPNPIVRKELLAVLRTPLYVRAVVVALVALALLVVSTAIAVSDESDATPPLVAFQRHVPQRRNRAGVRPRATRRP